MSETNKVFLIDGMSVVFRAYHAMSSSGLKNRLGEPTGAVFAFTNIVTSLLDRYKPDSIAVVFDTAAPTFRHEMYVEYKANRDEFPEELVPQLARIKEFLDLVNIPRIEKDGFEADDIIGTLAKQGAALGKQIVCLTSDKDYYQLVEENISLLKPGRKGEDFEVVNINEVLEKFGVMPEQVIDVLALTGDTADNVPGVKGIGEKTAIPLIQKFGNVEKIYENIESVERDSVKSKLLNAKEMAALSKVLVTIKTDVPLDFNIENCKLHSADFIKLDVFFKDMGFNTIRAKWRTKAPAGTNFASADSDTEINSDVPTSDVQSKDITSTKTKYEMVDSIDRLNVICRDLLNYDILSFDLETSSLDRNNCEIVGIAISSVENEAYYIPVEDSNANNSIVEADLFSNQRDSDENRWQESLQLIDALKILKPLLENPKIGKCGQNVKFDMYILKRYNIDVFPIAFDSMVASYIINPDDKHGMDALSEKYLNYKPIPISNLIGEKKANQKSMSELNPREISDYACEDADIALKLKNKLEPIIEKENLANLAYNIEFPLIKVLTDMEFNGVAIDVRALKEISDEVKIHSSRLSKLIYEEAGMEFNIDSPKQLGDILFEKLMIPGGKKNKTGYSTDVQVLTELSATYPIANYVLEYRQISKLQSTYLEALPKLINPSTGRVHTTYNQTVASTGRLSSTDPNLQNIPIRTDFGKEIRKAFVAQKEDYIIFAADYSQIELRIMAHICGDKQMIGAFKEGKDIHAATAALLNGITIDEVTQDMRRVAKTVNFGIMYGLGAFGLSQRLNISRTNAKEIIENYFEKYKGIRKYMEMTIASTRDKGYANTLCGRRRYFNTINDRNAALRNAAERGAINMPIQGTASDMMKIAMIKVHDFLKQSQLRAKMMLQVHDELVFEVHKDDLDDLKNAVTRLMSTALLLGEVPVVVDTGIGNNWYEAH
ncbi:MAG: DNA polymerase I [Candidatus Kapaibacterium sp.]|jgi:DNA polymerase-1|nr:DNA polymerase I [Candidatus Kapabacteria bacterium]